MPANSPYPINANRCFELGQARTTYGFLDQRKRTRLADTSRTCCIPLRFRFFLADQLAAVLMDCISDLLQQSIQMLTPTFQNFHRRCEDGPFVSYARLSSTMSSRPRLYKYLWQIFTSESPWENEDFFRHTPYLCTAALLCEIQRLTNAGHSCIIYGITRPRKGSGAPWDMNHPRWKNATFAPSWDDDTDPVCMNGHK
jgi:hypothetical protein